MNWMAISLDTSDCNILLETWVQISALVLESHVTLAIHLTSSYLQNGHNTTLPASLG